MKKIVFGIVLIILQSCNSKKSYELNVTFPNVEGLTTKSNVQSNGLEIGYVKKMKLINDGVLVTVAIEDSVKIPENSTFLLKEPGLMGDKCIDVVLNKTSKVNYKENDTIKGAVNKSERNPLKEMIKISKGE